VYRQQVNRPLPPTATISTRNGKRVARWRTKAGKWTTAEVVTRPDGREIIRVESGTYYAKYRDADGIVRVVPTGCRSEDAARQALARLERDAERVRVGVVTPRELATADAAAGSLARNIGDYVGTLTGSASHRDNTRRYLERLAADLGWQRLADLRRDDLERWLADQKQQGRSARSRNAFQTAAASFVNWCVGVSRMASNPFARMSKANLDADRRRQRRALTPDELRRLILAAQNAPGRPETHTAEGDDRTPRRPVERLTGDERGRVYAILAGTGLRVGELAELTVADVHLDARTPHIDLPARLTKNGEDATIPLRADLVELLRRRVEGRPPDAPLYRIPADFIKRFNADCKRAGIPKRDRRGRTVDLHALRTTFGTHLAAAGVPLTTAQKLMRHSDPKLTANIYTDPHLLDMAGAVASLPAVAPAPPSVTPTVTPAVALTGGTDSVTVSNPGKRRRRSTAS
jgi:integrase